MRDSGPRRRRYTPMKLPERARALQQYSPSSLGSMAPVLVITTGLGTIRIALLPGNVPVTVEYITKCVRAGLYNGRTFYRSDFVLQCGLHGSGVTHTFGDLPVNETTTGKTLSNTRGTCAIAHFDVPDCGNTEWFINLKDNTHLDSAYGGYCVFGHVIDDASFSVIDTIAQAVKGGTNTRIESMVVEEPTLSIVGAALEAGSAASADAKWLALEGDALVAAAKALVCTAAWTSWALRVAG